MNSSSIRRSIRCGAAALFLFVLTWLVALSISARADPITDWDVIAFSVAEASGKACPVTACDIAIAHVAMNDALNAIDRRYKPYAYDASAPRGSSPDAAIATAAHDVLVVRIPNQKQALDASLASALAAIPDGQAKADGVATGRAACFWPRFSRGAKRTDRTSLRPTLRAMGLGVWRSTPPAFAPAIGVGFGKVAPFTVSSVSQFDLPMAAYFNLRSAEYAADYNEVKSIGGAGSKTRTAEQSEIAKFWYEPVAGSSYSSGQRPGRHAEARPVGERAPFALLHLAQR